MTQTQAVKFRFTKVPTPQAGIIRFTRKPAARLFVHINPSYDEQVELTSLLTTTTSPKNPDNIIVLPSTAVPRQVLDLMGKASKINEKKFNVSQNYLKDFTAFCKFIGFTRFVGIVPDIETSPIAKQYPDVAFPVNGLTMMGNGQLYDPSAIFGEFFEKMKDSLIIVSTCENEVVFGENGGWEIKSTPWQETNVQQQELTDGESQESLEQKTMKQSEKIATLYLTERIIHLMSHLRNRSIGDNKSHNFLEFFSYAYLYNFLNCCWYIFEEDASIKTIIQKRQLKILELIDFNYSQITEDERKEIKILKRANID
ncbi:hypothetical protein A2526_01205 [candidate division WOR-1 bacterium RIFOXYD2_FULL_36_8]|nr:MAG: hypothetical protein A2526_01205 [candidate division WOR-1 bacterium RIFOXYD2_FULL_36_8]